MAESLAERTDRKHAKAGIIDADIHNALPSPDSLKPYLSERWQRHMETIGSRGTIPYAHMPTKYPKVSPLTARRDAWPPSGLLPGSDLSFMQEQHLDALNIEYGILNCMVRTGDELNEEWGAAMARAVNDWQIAEWLDKEPRLRASIVVPYESPDLAVEEIERLGDHSGFVQVELPGRTREPLGRRKYWKVYEAAERHNLAVGIHASDSMGVPTTASGWPSYYLDDHVLISTGYQSQIASLVCEGVFEQFPGLRVISVEGGFAWLPPLMWRLDKHWDRLRDEVPHLTRAPSEYIREHIWFTTQPMEEPPNPRHLLRTIEQIGADDKLMFSTDYPHWDFDHPNKAFPVKLPPELKAKIFSENARQAYQLDSKVQSG